MITSKNSRNVLHSLEYCELISQLYYEDTEHDAKKNNSYRWTIQGALIFMQVGLGLNFMAPTPMFTLIMDEYGITKALVSLTISAVLMVLTISLIPSGILITRIGANRAMRVAGLLMSAGLLHPFVDSYPAVINPKVSIGYRYSDLYT